MKISVENGTSSVQLLNDIDGLLTQYVGVFMSPVELLMKLQNIGINLLPLENDAAKCGCSKKSQLVDDFAYNAVSILSVSCSFRSTHFCHASECGENKIILKMRENEDKVI